MAQGKLLLAALGCAASMLVIGQGAASRTGDAPRALPGAPDGTGAHAAPHAEAMGHPPRTGPGADVIVSKISGQISSIEADGNRAYAAGTTSCNIGSEPLEWFGNSNRHPVVAQNMFRLAPRQNGHLRFEQLGQGWLKHGFCALDLDLGSCETCTQDLGCNLLAVGCEDPYSAVRNFAQAPLGPKYQVNATTGYFPYPPANPQWNGPLARRLHAPLADTLPASNPGAHYLIEVQYVHPQDAPAVNWNGSLNNVSYRRMQLDGSAAFTGYIGSTVTGQPAIHYWKSADPQVTLSNVDVRKWGRMIVGSRAYDNGDDTWDYEYAVYNMNFDRAIGSFSVPMPENATVTDIEFRDVRYHSGEAFEYADDDGVWRHSISDGALTWSTPQSWVENINGNAIRWGTVYNFRMTADVPPVEAAASLRAFNPFPSDEPDIFTAAAQVPEVPATDPCPADLTGSGSVGFGDLIALLEAWGPCPNCPEDLTGDDEVGFDDLLALLSAWGDCS